ncbi:vomeronasal type-1 receptor 90-like [Arvicanthis niloticus]|uniref:vomeronasal type-1 receptor 90-like n=1 Tax=Arvicanthis niloticus TaxID=61156 RepID=UPI0014872B43|nr:vomeronasal type-1 receptor 90-like [Arvicanthis niloticus]
MKFVAKWMELENIILSETSNVNDIKCKATLYTSRVMRGQSICITCILSVFQAITISPSTSFLAKFKDKLKKYMINALCYIWFFNLSVCSNMLFYVGGFTNVSETKQMKVTKSCSLFPMNYIVRGLLILLSTSRDVFLVAVMLTTSAYMVNILHRHQRQCKYLHSISSLIASPEKKATQTILLLVIFFVVMYWVDFIISLTLLLLWIYNPVVLTAQKFVMYAYPTITPLVQIISDKRIINVLKNLQSQCH